MPLCALVFGLLLLIPKTLILHVIPTDDGIVANAFVVVCAIALAAFTMTRTLLWTLSLEGEHVKLGPFPMAPKIRYDRVRFLRVGTFEGAMLSATRNSRLSSSPVLIHSHWLRRYRIWLEHSDAQRCFDALRKHCENAAGVNLLGAKARDYLPSNPAAQTAAASRLRTFWALLSIAILGTGATLLIAALAQGGLFRAEFWEFAMLAPLFMGFGWYAVRRARHHHGALHGSRSGARRHQSRSVREKADRTRRAATIASAKHIP